jgi:hypothetical protein
MLASYGLFMDYLWAVILGFGGGMCNKKTVPKSAFMGRRLTWFIWGFNGSPGPAPSYSPLRASFWLSLRPVRKSRPEWKRIGRYR